MYGKATLFAQNLFDSDRQVMVSGNDAYIVTQQRSLLCGASVEIRF